ncbi:MAG: DUF2341 domain-containing protein, partial [Verrucomicrobiota bacterium]
ADSTFSVLWEGAIEIDIASDYTFGTSSDEGSVLYLDLNRDGDFADVNELIVNNLPGNGVMTGTVYLTEGCYSLVTAFHETTGAESMEVCYGLGAGLPYNALTIIHADAPEFGQSCPTRDFAIANISSTNIGAFVTEVSGEIDFFGAAFDVRVFWGATDGGTNPLAWDNNRMAGSFTNQSNFVVSTVLSNLSDVEIYYTFFASNCFDTIWAEPSSNFVVDPGPINISNFLYQTTLNFCGYDRAETLSNFPALVAIGPSLPGFAYTQLHPAGHDLRFTDAGQNELNHDIDTWNTNGTSYVWVRVPQLSSSTSIQAWWGNTLHLVPPKSVSSTWADEFRIVHHLSETNGLHVDATANANNGNSVNSTQDGTGIIGGANHFDGDNDYVNMFAPPGLLNINDFTYSLWIRVDSYENGLMTSGSGDYFISRTPITVTQIIALKPSNDSFGFQTRYNNGSGLGGPTGGTISGGWQHIAMTRTYNDRF